MEKFDAIFLTGLQKSNDLDIRRARLVRPNIYGPWTFDKIPAAGLSRIRESSCSVSRWVT